MIIQGRVLKLEPVSGTSNGQAYSYLRAHVLDEAGLLVQSCRVGDDFGPIKESDEITAVCRVQPYIDRREGGAKLSVSLVAPYRAPARAQS